MKAVVLNKIYYKNVIFLKMFKQALLLSSN